MGSKRTFLSLCQFSKKNWSNWSEKAIFGLKIHKILDIKPFDFKPIVSPRNTPKSMSFSSLWYLQIWLFRLASMFLMCFPNLIIGDNIAGITTTIFLTQESQLTLLREVAPTAFVAFRGHARCLCYL